LLPSLLPNYLLLNADCNSSGTHLNAVAEFRTCHLITGRRINDRFSSSKKIHISRFSGGKSYTSSDSQAAQATHQQVAQATYHSA